MPDERSVTSSALDATLDATLDAGLSPESLLELESRMRGDGTILAGEDPRRTVPPFVGTLPVLPIEGCCDGPPELSMGSTLGEGGMGIVRSARQLSLSRDVAVKQRKAESGTHGLEALLREAWITGSLEHPNIIPVYALGRDHEDNPVFVMKRVEGVTWDALLSSPEHRLVREHEGDALDFHLGVLEAVCDAVAFAHSRGIIHRDLKPENVMLGDFGEVYVLDWGIAVADGDVADSRLPHARDVSSIAGTPAYMAPEMVEPGDHAPITTATDVYLLGAILHEILTGQPPHAADNLIACLTHAKAATPPTLPDDLAPDLRDICQRALARDPAQRFPSARAFSRAISQHRRHRAALELAERASAQLEELERRVPTEASDDAAVSELYSLFGACRFGFEQVIADWPGHPSATTGHERATRVMVQLELARGNEQAAAAWLHELPPAPELEAELEALRQRRAEEARELAALRADRADIETGITKAERWRAGVAQSGIWLALGILFGFLARHDIFVAEHLTIIGLNVIITAIGIAYVFAYREQLATTRQNRSAAHAVVGIYIMATVLFWIMRQIGLDFPTSIGILMVFLGTSSMCIVNFIDTRLLPAPIVYMACALILIPRPEWVYEVLGGSNALVVLIVLALIHKLGEAPSRTA